MSRSSSRRGMGLVIVLLVILAVVADLMRPNSFLLGLVNGEAPAGTQLERTIDRVQRTRPRFQRPNSLRTAPGDGPSSVVPTRTTPA